MPEGAGDADDALQNAVCVLTGVYCLPSSATSRSASTGLS